jgi:metal-responsive CopG/Arc/MetJ family transcriptional regulator
MRGKTKVSVSVHTQLLRKAERVGGKLSRSAIFEEALAGWLRQHRQAQLDRAIEDYYLSLRASDRAEDDAWAGAGDETVRRSWDEPKR